MTDVQGDINDLPARRAAIALGLTLPYIDSDEIEDVPPEWDYPITRITPDEDGFATLPAVPD